MTSRPRWLSRYLDGEHAPVWDELHRLGARVREPTYLAEAQAVCDEWARRARMNIERIVERLDAQGYRFHVNDADKNTTVPLAPPSAAAADYVRWLEDLLGPVPMTLSSWVRVVGDVWLVGTHPLWPDSSAADPLVLEIEGTRYPGDDIRAAVLEEFEMWQEDPQDEPFRLQVAPDALHKNNVSGGPGYGITLPNLAADCLIHAGEQMHLVRYIQRCLDRGGFSKCSDAERAGAVIAALRTDLLSL